MSNSVKLKPHGFVCNQTFPKFNNIPQKSAYLESFPRHDSCD